MIVFHFTGYRPTLIVFKFAKRIDIPSNKDQIDRPNHSSVTLYLSICLFTLSNGVIEDSSYNWWFRLSGWVLSFFLSRATVTEPPQNISSLIPNSLHLLHRMHDNRFHFRHRQAEIQWTKGDIIENRRHKQLVIRVLKDHADRPSH